MFDAARELVLKDRAKAKKTLAAEMKRQQGEELDAELDQLAEEERQREERDAADQAKAKATGDAAAAETEDGEVDIQPLAGALADPARRRREAMVTNVLNADPAMTRAAAEDAVDATDVGSTLADILDMAERIETAAPSLSKALDDRLAKKETERDVIKRAKGIQLDKAKAGAPVSLVHAIEIAKVEINAG